MRSFGESQPFGKSDVLQAEAMRGGTARDARATSPPVCIVTAPTRAAPSTATGSIYRRFNESLSQIAPTGKPTAHINPGATKRINTDILNEFPAGSRAHFDALACICGLTAFLIEHGRPLTRVGRCPPDKMGPMGECYANAGRMAISDWGTRYCEGFAWVPENESVVRHGWVLGSDGAVIEPTWPDTKASLYFGLVFTREFHLERLMSKGATWQLWRTEYDLRRWLSPGELQRMLDPRWQPRRRHGARRRRASSRSWPPGCGRRDGARLS
jgi:hypothetical protein